MLLLVPKTEIKLYCCVFQERCSFNKKAIPDRSLDPKMPSSILIWAGGPIYIVKETLLYPVKIRLQKNRN